MNQNQIKLLQEMPIFGGLEGLTLNFLVDRAENLTFEPYQYLFREHDPANALFVIEAGRIAVIKSHEDRHFQLCTLTQGDCVGEMAVIDLSPRSASVITLTQACFIRIGWDTLYKLRKSNLQQFTMIQLNIAREMSRRLRQTDEALFQARLSMGDLELWQ